MKKNILICIDRDGTLIYDKKYYMGHTKNWKSRIKFLKNVIKGLRLLNKELPDAPIYMITNQPGVAIKDFPLLTEKRANEVCLEVLKKLEKKRAIIKDYILCSHVSPSYVKKRKEFKFNKKLICNCSCIKPKPGMIKEALKKESLEPNKTKIYVIGDRASDIKTALNAKGFGILIPFKEEPYEKEKVKNIKTKNKYIAKGFLDAARFIVKREK